MKIGAHAGCHQLYERSFHVKGWQFPVCTRCTGLFVGEVSGLLMLIGRGVFEKYSFMIFFAVWVVALLPLAIDGLGQLAEKWVSNNGRRFVTGLICGLFSTTLIIKIVLCLLHI